MVPVAPVPPVAMLSVPPALTVTAELVREPLPLRLSTAGEAMVVVPP